MAPIMAQVEIEVDMLLMAVSTLLVCSSLIVLLALCGCCTDSQGKRDEKKGPRSEPKQPASDKAQAAQAEEAIKGAPVLPQTSDRAMEKSEEKKSLILSKKESLLTSKLVAKQQPTKEQPKVCSIKAAPTAEPKSERKLQSKPLDQNKSLAETKIGGPVLVEGSVLRPSAVPQLSATGEPTYPAEEAVEFENPAYDTIGPEFDDPFPEDQAPEHSLKVAVLVESVQHTSEKDQSKKTQSKAPTAATPTQKSVAVSKSFLPTVSRAKGATKTMKATTLKTSATANPERKKKK